MVFQCMHSLKSSSRLDISFFHTNKPQFDIDVFDDHEVFVSYVTKQWVHLKL